MKKAISVLLLLSMLISLYACSSETPAETTSGSDTTINTDATSSPSSPITTNPPITEPVVTLPPVTGPFATEPPVTEPPVTEPPATEPPATEPPATEPPVTKPPVTEPPATEPPVTRPPVTEPPVTKPPVTEPPVTQPPATKPPVTEPPKNNEAEMQAKYEYAVELLEYYYDRTVNNQPYYTMPEYNDDLKDAYLLFVELGDYKDAKEYADQFIVVPDVLLSVYDSDYYPESGRSDFGYQHTYHYNADGSVLARIAEYSQLTVYKCDKDGKITQSSSDDMFSGGIYYYYYDDNNMLVKVDYAAENHWSQVKTEEYTYTYNHQGQIIQEEEVNYNSNGSIQYRFVTQYEYDEKGRISRDTMTKYYNSEETIYVSEYVYNSNGYVKTRQCIEGDEYEKAYYTETEYTYGTYYYYPSTYEHNWDF